MLWRELRGRALAELRFRRQHPFGYYILDFYCVSERIAVEVDGWSHSPLRGQLPRRGRDSMSDDVAYYLAPLAPDRRAKPE